MASLPPVTELPFADARGCKAWLAALPIANVPLAQSQVVDVLAAMQGGGFDAFERLKCLELMRDRVAFLLGEQHARLAGKALPLSVGDDRAWQSGLALATALEAAYRAVLADALASTTDLRRHAALAAQRMVRALAAQVAMHLDAHRQVEPPLWGRLNHAYAQAEAANLAEERVKDSLEGLEGASSVAEAYVQVLLAAAAMPFELTSGQSDFVEAVTRTWARKVTLRRAMPEETLPPALHPLVVDVASATGASALAPRMVTAHHRVLDTLALSRSIRRRIQGIRAGEDVAQLKLPVQAAGIDVAALLERLHRAWCEAPAPKAAPRAADTGTADIVVGISAIHFFVTGGKAFEAPDHSRDLTSQEKQDMEVFGRVSERTQSLRAAEHVIARSEAWTMVDELAGAWRLRRPPKGTQAVAVGRLVAVRLAESAPFFLGGVKAVVQEGDGAVVMTVMLFPGKPEAMAVRADARGRVPTKWQEGFKLPAFPKLNLPASLVVPSGVAVKGRGLDLWDEGARTLESPVVLDHGTDFDRVALP